MIIFSEKKIPTTLEFQKIKYLCSETLEYEVFTMTHVKSIPVIIVL